MLFGKYDTVDEAIAAFNGPNAPFWPSSRDYRLWVFKETYMMYRLNQSSTPDDGFGWAGLHKVEGSGHTSASGYHRSKRRAFFMKECKPFAIKLLVWDEKKAMAFAKKYWEYYTDEEKKELEAHLVKAFLKDVDLNQVRRESAFAQWSERAKDAPSRAVAADKPHADFVLAA